MRQAPTHAAPVSDEIFLARRGAVERLRRLVQGEHAVGALARLPGEERRRIGDRPHLLHAPRAVEHDIAASVENGLAPFAMVPGERVHRNVIAEEQPVETNSPADDIADHGP